MFVGRAPLRISFGGGGTDLEEYHNKFDGYSISYTIDRFTYVIGKLRDDDKLQGFSPDFSSHLPPEKHSSKRMLQGHEIVLVGLREMKFKKGIDMYLSSDVKPNSGLGASSSLTTNFVNVISNIQGARLSKDKLALKAYRIGHDVLKWGIGKQDEFAASYGGLNLFKFTKNKVTAKPIRANKSTLKELQDNSLLLHIGTRNHSKGILKSQTKSINEKNKITLEALHKAKEIALEMFDALNGNDLTRFYSCINEGWKAKQNYTKGVTNDRIEKISKNAIKKGALAAKITGAGGGGHMYIYANKSKHKAIIKSLKRFGVKHVDFNFVHKGAQVFNIRDL